uniref:CMP/dCMP-type deaminase domain-containing protein n=1 Tax=Panagrolaimus sp. PS1159 TaxID=55785 RepID=A0AC35GXU7_9BILA
MSSSEAQGFQIALDEAYKGYEEKGIPIGAALVDEDGTILGRGHNMRIQKSSPTLHAEIAALENAGRLSANIYRRCTMYTTLSPCDMCSGACILYGIKKVVIGENSTFVGAEKLLESKGIKTEILNNEECKHLMAKFIKKYPEKWAEDI